MSTAEVTLYADHNATTAVTARSLAAMLPYLQDIYGNPSSGFHSQGAQSASALAEARRQLASLLHCEAESVVFTSGGTESCLMAFLGAARAQPDLDAVLISSVEHPAVWESAKLLQEIFDIPLRVIPVNSQGRLDMEAFSKALQECSRPFVSLMYANNETGVVFPLAELAALARSRDAVIHCDATQAVGKVLLEFSELGIDLLSLSGHKFGSPKGVGALIVRDHARWMPLMPGGGQEGGRRGGTEAVAQAVALGAAASERAELLTAGLSQSMRKTRDAFEARLRALWPELEVHGETEPRLPNTSSIYLPTVHAIEVRNELAGSGIVVSTGSACASGHASASPVLLALGRTPIECLSVFRISFGVEHTERDAEMLAETLVRVAKADIERRQKEILARLSKE